MKKQVMIGLAVAMAPILLVLSSWGYGRVSVYQALQASAYGWQKPLYTIGVYLPLGVVLGVLLTRFTARDERRAGAVSFAGGLLLIGIFGVVYALYARADAALPIAVHNFLILFDLRELYFWGGMYAVQIVCRGTMRGDALPQEGTKGRGGAILNVVLLPALLLVMSALAAERGVENDWRGQNAVFYSVIGILFGLIPWMCRTEKNKLRGAVAVTCGLGGAILAGMLSELPTFALLQRMNEKEVFLWIGLYFWLMISLLREGYREKNQGK